jgi:hypothetical protein
MPSVFVKNVVQIAFLEWPLINANIFGKIFLDALYDCIYFFPSPRPRAVAREGIGGGMVNPSTFLKLTYSENRVGHSENYGNSVTKFKLFNRENII